MIYSITNTMKNTLLITALVLVLNQTYGAPINNEAVAYLNKVTAPVNGLKNETWQYLKAITRGRGARKVENKRQKLLNELEEAKRKVKGVGAYQSDNALKKSVVQYLGLTHTVLNEDFGKILNMEEIAEQSYDAMEAYLLAKERAHAKLDSASALMRQAEKNFAAKYGINLIESEADRTSQKIQRASETLDYYNDVYLIFFKSYKEEMYILDALQRSDISAIEQHGSALISFADEGMGQLKAAGDYQYDASLRLAAQRMLGFYRGEAEKDIPTIVDFYLKKDRFEQMQKKMDAKKKKDVTQADIDQFNKAVSEYNESINSFNARNDALNRKRADRLDEWNKAVKSFFDKHGA